MKRYYFDTSIWLDFFENRNELNMPKGNWVHKLLDKVTKDNDKVICSDIVMLELETIGYLPHELEKLFEKVNPLIIFVESTEKEARKAKDLSLRLNIPRGDALHALIAKDNKAVMVTLDNHFKKLINITKAKKPNEII